MNIIEELEKIYNGIDDLYAQKEFEARSKGFNIKEEEFQDIRFKNDHSYFLLAFTRLEDRIKTIASNLIQVKSDTLNSWSYKRVWNILKRRDKNDRLHMMEYVELLTEKGQTDYNIIKGYYDNRNTIAHGGVLESIDMKKAYSDFKRLYKELST